MKDALPTLSAEEVREVLYDGADLMVTHRDGRRESVKVRKIPRNEYGAYALVVTDDTEEGERAELKLYVPDRDVPWWCSLTDDSRDAIAAEGERLNFTSFARWWRRAARNMRLLQGQSETVAIAEQLLTRSTPPAPRNGSPVSGTAAASNGRGARPSGI
jgi:hypothetical protein